jgi:hypothetical protein
MECPRINNAVAIDDTTLLIKFDNIDNDERLSYCKDFQNISSQ